MATNRRLVASSGADFYPTPAWVTRALLKAETFEGGIWEPACGNCDMANELETGGYTVRVSDIASRDVPVHQLDFLSDHGIRADNIVTNPPFNIAEDFVLKALSCVEHKAAFFLRTAFLESATRWRSIFSTAPPARVHIFSERASLYPAGKTAKGGGTTSYAWFVWDKAVPPGPPQIFWIPPGAKTKD